MTAADSLRNVIAVKDSLLQIAATRPVHITVPPQHVTVSLPHDPWYATSFFTTLLGGFLATAAGIGLMFWTRHLERTDQRRQLAQAVGTELAVFQARIIGACLQLAGRLGGLNHELLNSLRAAVPNRVVTTELERTSSTIDTLIGLPDPQTAWAPPKPPGARKTSLSMKRYELPYVGSGSARIDLLHPATGALLLQVQSALALFNQHVDDASRYHWMTFEELADENHLATQENLEKTYKHLLDAALHLVALVARALARPDFADLEAVQPETESEPDEGVSAEVLATGITKEEVERRKSSEEASRILLRPAERIRQAFHGIEAKISNQGAFQTVGPLGLKTDIENLIAGIADMKTQESQAQLVRLHDATLEKKTREAIVSADRAATEIANLASPYYRPDVQRPWDNMSPQLFHRHAESMRTHFLYVWDKVIIAGLKALHGEKP